MSTLNVVELRKKFPIGSELFTDVNHVSRSGMTRSISVYRVRRGRIEDVTHVVADVLGARVDARGGVVVRGCGMDMGFHLVYRFSSAVYHGSRSKKIRPHRAGYAIKQRWL